MALAALSGPRRGLGTLAVCFVLVVAVLVAGSLTTFWSSSRIERHASWVTHTHTMLHTLDDFLAALAAAEAGQHGYTIAGDERFLAPYRLGRARVERLLNEVGELTRDNPDQRKRLDEIRRLAERRLADMQEVINTRATVGFDAARQLLVTAQTSELMDRLRSLLAEMEAEELRLLDIRSAQARRAYRDATIANAATFAVSVALVAVIFHMIRRHARQQDLAARVIREQRDQLRVTLASIGDGVIVTDEHLNVTLLNSVAESLTGWPADAAIGKPLEEVFRIVHEQTRRPAPNPARQALREGSIVYLANHTLLISRDGTDRPIDDSAAPIRGIGGETMGVVLAFRDVTDRRAREHELRRMAADLSEADRRKDQFIATLAHELRNPLAPIVNCLEVLQRADLSPECITQACTVMDRQVRQLVRLVDDLLDLSRITRNKLELRRERVDLQSILRWAIETSQPAMDLGGHTLQISMPDTPIYLTVDPVRMTQVIANLLNNAAKYTDRAGQIVLTAGLMGGQVRISVRDSGIGIARDQLSDVFDAFSQSDQARARSSTGLGIGLSLVRRLVEMHDGTVEARSDGPAKGSEFIVTLPAPDPYTPPAAHRDTESAAITRPLHILVVDDNHDAAASLVQILQLTGHQAEMVHDGPSAVEAALRGFDVILLDIGLPLMSGYDVCRRIREQPAGGNILIAALTGWGQEEDRARSTEAGFDIHMIKPVDFAALEDVLRQATCRAERSTHA